MYPNLQALIYGDPGVGKSHFAATWPKPMLVLFTDPRAKAMPYLRRGKITEKGVTDCVPFEAVASKKTGEPIIRVEYYHDTDIKGGNSVIYAYERLEDRMVSIYDEVNNGEWATIVLDSLSFMEYQIRKLHQYKLNPESNAGKTQDARQWYHSSSEAIEEFCYSRLAWLPTNVLVLAHVRDSKANIRGNTTWTPEAPGTKARKLPGAFGEVYVVHATGEGRYLQTVNDTEFIATSQIDAPDGCDLHYNTLWDNWNTENTDE